MLCAAPLVQAEQEPEYAHPTEDPETFELNDYPAEPIQAPLEDDGTFVMPNFILAELEDDSTTYWTYYQEPLPGAEFHGPQTITVELQSVNEDGTETRTGRFDLELLDVTPPNVEINLISDGSTFISPSGGHPYFVAPAQVEAEVLVTDAVDGDLEVTIGHNGEAESLHRSAMTGRTARNSAVQGGHRKRIAVGCWLLAVGKLCFAAPPRRKTTCAYVCAFTPSSLRRFFRHSIALG